jgi:hypothetical protein
MIDERLTDRVEDKPRWYGMYPGVVVSTADPEKRRRMRVRVPQVYGDPTTESEFIPDDALPWAFVCSPNAGANIGEAWLPKAKAMVVVAFWAGDGEWPIVMGDVFAMGQLPPEFVSSYAPDPQTRVVKTDGGQRFEMRWKKGEEKIELVGPKGTTVTLDESLPTGKVTVRTALQTVVLDDAAVPKVTVNTPGEVDVTAALKVSLIAGTTVDITAGAAVTVNAAGPVAVTSAAAVTVTGQGVAINSTGGAPSTQTGGGTITSNFVGAASYTFAAALTYIVGLALSFSVGGAMTLASVGVASLFGAAGVLLGSAGGTKRRLIDERLFALLNALITAYNTHEHSALNAPPSVGVPVPAIGAVTDISTTDTRAS